MTLLRFVPITSPLTACSVSRMRSSELDWTLLSFVSSVRLATGKQLGRRFWSAAREGDSAEARAARRALARLARWRVLDPLPRRVGGKRPGAGQSSFALASPG